MRMNSVGCHGDGGVELMVDVGGVVDVVDVVDVVGWMRSLVSWISRPWLVEKVPSDCTRLPLADWRMLIMSTTVSRFQPLPWSKLIG